MKVYYIGPQIQSNPGIFQFILGPSHSGVPRIVLPIMAPLLVKFTWARTIHRSHSGGSYPIEKTLFVHRPWGMLRLNFIFIKPSYIDFFYVTAADNFIRYMAKFMVPADLFWSYSYLQSYFSKAVGRRFQDTIVTCVMLTGNWWDQFRLCGPLLAKPWHNL